MVKNGKSIYGLSAKSYTDQQFWETECNTVLSNGWLFVGFVHELLKSGDVHPILIAGNFLRRQMEILFMRFHRVFQRTPIRKVLFGAHSPQVH